MFKGIDLFSDTVTRPSAAMKQAMIAANLGDEQKAEDPTTKQLEERMAKLLGFSHAMFFPSATMANEVAIRALCDPGDELIAAANCHLFVAEAGGPAIHANVMTKPIDEPTGIFSSEQIRHLYRSMKSPLIPVTKLVSIENTTNMGGGYPWPKATLDSVKATAKELDLKLHLDGARFFHASIASGMSPQEITSGFDTVTICFSKGLGCPIGAILAFDQQHYAKVRRLKQLMGGAMRQSGMLTAACLYALDHNIERLADDHANAKLLAEKLTEIQGIEVENKIPATNMVFFKLTNPETLSPEKFLEHCQKHNLRFSRPEQNRFRAVTHLDVSRDDILRAGEIVTTAF